MKLFNHQKQAVRFLMHNKGIGAIFHDIGMGKTLTALETFKRLRESNEDLKMYVVCPLSLIEGAWGEDIKKFTNYRYCNLHEKRKKKQKKPPFDIYIVNYEWLLHNDLIDYVGQKETSMIVLDECFHGDTLIDTPQGQRRIKEIKKDDYVYNCLGVCKVLDTKIKKLDTKIKITYNNKEISCSENHPFFTSNGWRFAKNLKKGDLLVKNNYAMSIMQFNFQSRTIIEEILRNELLCEMENAATRDKSQDLYSGNCEENIYRAEEILKVKSSCCHSTNRADKKPLSVKESCCQEENINEASTDEVETNCSRWQRKTNTYTPKQTLEIIRQNMATRIFSIFRKKKKRVSYSLQNRHSSSSKENRNRSGWFLPHGRIEENSRQEKNQSFKFFRVENIEIQKQRDNGKSSKSSQDYLFYDLKIEDHPSYSVNNVLVHNSSKIKNNRASITKILLAHNHYFKHRIIMSGTPAPNIETEYWAQMTFLNYGIFHHKFNAFKNKFFHLSRGTQVMQGQYMSRSMARDMFSHGWESDITDEKRKELILCLKPHCHYADKDKCLDLPDRVDEKRFVYMNPKQSSIYNQMKKYCLAEIEGQDIVAQVALTKIMKLRQITSGFAFDDHGIARAIDGTSPKIKELQNIIEEIGKKQLIIWCQFHWEIEALQQIIGNCSVLYGKVPANKRQEEIEKFKEGKNRFLIAHPASAGHGLTFVNCSIQIFFSLNYSWEQYIQAKGRTHRPGQTRKCVYIHLLCDDTIDGIIYDVLNKKGDSQEIVKEFLA